MFIQYYRNAGEQNMKVHMNAQVLGTQRKWVGYWGFKWRIWHRIDKQTIETKKEKRQKKIKGGNGSNSLSTRK